MLKYRCRGCGQNIVVVERTTGSAHTCPRCGVVNDLAASAKAPGLDEKALVSDMFDREEVAQQRRAAEEVAEEAEREAERARQIEASHKQKERLSRIGGAGLADEGKRSGVPWVFGTIAFVVLISAIVGAMLRGGDKSQERGDGAFGEVSNGTGIEQRVREWATSLSSRMTYLGKPVYVYDVWFDGVERDGANLLVNGAVLLSDRHLTQSERLARAEAKSERKRSKVGESGEVDLPKANGKESLREGLGLIKDAYDLDRMAETTGLSSLTMANRTERTQNSPKVVSASEAERASEVLRKVGIGSSAEEAETPKELDVARRFVCIVRQDDSVATFPGGIAMAYFAWREQLDGSTLTLLKGAELRPIAELVDQVFRDMNTHSLDEADVIRTYGGKRRVELFPAVFRPRKWEVVYADQARGGAVRAFVRVEDEDSAKSGTWILSLLNLEADRRYRVVDVWRSSL